MSIKKDLASGVLYTSLAKYSGIVISLIISGILARLLTPDDFGVVAIATVIIVFFNMLGDIGIGPAIIQRQNLTDDDLNQIYTLTVYIGLLLGAIFFASSYKIADWYENQQLVGVCQWLSLSILISCVNIVPVNLQYKAKRFKLLAIVTLTAQITSGVASVVYAYNGGGVYALVMQTLVSSVLIFIVYAKLAKLRFVFKVTKEAISKILSFSVYQFLFNFVNYFSRNLDKLLVGRYIGLTPLGYYDKSYRLMMMPLQNITFVITPVLLPVFSQLQNDKKEVSSKYEKILEMLSYISFPLAVVLFFCGRELILLIFGPQWELAVLPFKILSFTVALQILTSTSGSIYQAIDYTKGLFISGCWCALFMVLSFTITIFAFGTIEAVCYGFLIAQLFNTSQTFILLFKKLEYPALRFIKIIIKPVLIGCLMFVGLFIVEYLCNDIDSLMLLLFIKCAVALLIWVTLIQCVSPYNIKTLIRGNFPKILKR
jgi:PST family polysaccharide transporter